MVQPGSSCMHVHTALLYDWLHKLLPGWCMDIVWDYHQHQDRLGCKDTAQTGNQETPEREDIWYHRDTEQLDRYIEWAPRVKRYRDKLLLSCATAWERQELDHNCRWNHKSRILLTWKFVQMSHLECLWQFKVAAQPVKITASPSACWTLVKQWCSKVQASVSLPLAMLIMMLW